MRILLVEDTGDVGEAIAANLRRNGHAVDWEQDGLSADEILQIQDYDLVVLDVGLPGLDGFTLLRRLRARRARVPVLMLTARSQVEDRVDALDVGADDYMVKPFDFREFEARVRALLRRAPGEPTNVVSCGDVTIDRANRTVRVAGAPLELTRRELMLLELLAGRPGRVFGKDEIVERLFGYDESPSVNAVEQYVARLRRRLSGSTAEIRTLRGLGYQMVCR